MSKTVFLFSGQGSQYCGMGASFADNIPECREIFDLAGGILGFDLLDKCRNATAEELSQTVISQPAIMAVSLCAARALEKRGIKAQAAAGHSLGEYAAMVYSGIVTIEDGFRLIKARSEAMQRAAEKASGAMYAIIGKTPAEIEEVCEKTEGYVVPVNYNSAVQTVIAGETAAVSAAAASLTEMGARAVKLGVLSAFHSKLMQPAADEFLPFAKQIGYKEPRTLMMSNISGGQLDSVENLGERLAMHIVSPVRFTDELAALDSMGFDRYIECGPGKVLTGLVKKTLKGANAVNVQDMESLEKAVNN